MAEKDRPRRILAISIGLCAALLLAGGALMVAGFRSTPDCDGLDEPACEAKQDVARDLAGYELGIGFGLFSLGAVTSLWLWLGERRKAAKGVRMGQPGDLDPHRLP